MKALDADPARREPAPSLDRRADTSETAAYDRLTDTERMVAHDEQLPLIRGTTPASLSSASPSTVWEGPPTQGQYVDLVVVELDSYAPAFRRWVLDRLPAPAG